jgi:hypothetical protein
MPRYIQKTVHKTKRPKIKLLLICVLKHLKDAEAQTWKEANQILQERGFQNSDHDQLISNALTKR